MKMQIAPSILSANFAALGADCTRVLDAGAAMLHFDVMDGTFVPAISFGVPVLASLQRVLPQAVYDVHLMVQNPLQQVRAFAQAGAAWLTFHCEAGSPIQETIDAIHEQGILAGISLRPNTPVEQVFDALDTVDMVLVMSVEPGAGGQAFMPEAVERIAALRKEANARGRTALRIEVDGGITAQTAPLCSAAGASVFVAGSAVFGKADYEVAISEILTACGETQNGGIK